jgi:DNA-binding Lrp family transcriptional regulator
MVKKSATEEGLVRLFGSISRARILALLLDSPGRRLDQREIMYEIGFPLQPVQRELSNLVALGILKRIETYNRVYYEIDVSSPFYEPLKEMYRVVSQQ